MLTRKSFINLLQDGPLFDTRSRLCLQADMTRQSLYMTFCNFTLLPQKWRFTHYTADFERLGVGTVNMETESFTHLLWEVVRNIKQNKLNKLSLLAKKKDTK